MNVIRDYDNEEWMREIMKSEWERIEMNGNVIGCDIGVGFDSIRFQNSTLKRKQMNEWMNE